MSERLTYANIMATVAVFLALGGGAYAATHLGKNSTPTRHSRRRKRARVVAGC
jgi:hypothetical protein